MKVLLILVDGMRPDSLANIPLEQEFAAKSLHTMYAKTVMPCLTLPCHMSLFHSVPPERHGVYENEYPPQPHPEHGLCEVLYRAWKKSAMFYSWGELRDIAGPGMLSQSMYVRGNLAGYRQTMEELTEGAVKCMAEGRADFIFLYLGMADEAGHKAGWMSDEYRKALAYSWELIDRAVKAAGNEYAVIVTSDHGGHELDHWLDIPEDMTIPLFISHKDINPGKLNGSVSIMDIAPTITTLMGIPADSSWEGRSLL